ncbi:MAG: DUF4366 domain-containing protein [Suipraeoptans sp.]
MSKIDEFIATTKLNELVHKKDDEKVGKVILWVLAIVGAVVAVAGIAYAVYTFFAPDYLEDFEDDFDDDFDDDFFKSDEAAE